VVSLCPVSNSQFEAFTTGPGGIAQFCAMRREIWRSDYLFAALASAPITGSSKESTKVAWPFMGMN